MPTARYAHATSAATALSTTAAILTLGELATDGAEAVPDECLLGLLELQITSIAESAAVITWRLCRDAEGDHAMTLATESAIIVGATTATDGGCAASISVPYHRANQIGTAGRLYVVAVTDAGTCTATARLSFERAL